MHEVLWAYLLVERTYIVEVPRRHTAVAGYSSVGPRRTLSVVGCKGEGEHVASKTAGIGAPTP